MVRKIQILQKRNDGDAWGEVERMGLTVVSGGKTEIEAVHLVSVNHNDPSRKNMDV